MADITKEQVVEFISNMMTVLELAGFIKELEERFEPPPPCRRCAAP